MPYKGYYTYIYKYYIPQKYTKELSKRRTHPLSRMAVVNRDADLLFYAINYKFLMNRF